MPSFIEVFDVEPHLLRVTTTGQYVFDELFDFLVRVKAEAIAAKRDRVLIDSSRLEGNMTEAERFQGGQKIAQLFGPNIALALVMPPEQITKLGEMAAVNRGGRFLVTDSEAEALEWLAAGN